MNRRELIALAERYGLYIRTYSPGDGARPRTAAKVTMLYRSERDDPRGGFEPARVRRMLRTRPRIKKGRAA